MVRTVKPTTSLGKALRLLRLLGAGGDWTGVRDLARQAGFTPSSTHSLLQILRADGFVEFDANRRQYRLGLAILALADGIDAVDALGSFARPWVTRLAGSLGETVFALSWRGGQAVVVACAEAKHELHISVAHRVIDRPHTWASGQMLLAWQSATERDAYLRSHADAGPQLALAAGQRERGWAEAINVDDSGVAAFGAPVVDPSGHCVLAIGASVALARATPARQDDIRSRLVATATSMSAALASPVH